MLLNISILLLILCKISCLYGEFLKYRPTSKTKSPLDSLETTLKKEHIIHASENHTGTVFFLHGLGSRGEIFHELIMNMRVLGLSIPHPYLKLVFLTAPLLEVTYLNKQKVNAWYDMKDLSPNASDQYWITYEFVIRDLKRYIWYEVDTYALSWDRMIMGGFAMGGSMALNIGYSYGWELAGVFALSSFLCNKATLYREMKIRPRKKYPQLFWYHGEEDDTVKFEWGNRTYHELIKRGVKGEFHSNPELGHRMNLEEMALLLKWCARVVPTDYTTPAWTWFWK